MGELAAGMTKGSPYETPIGRVPAGYTFLGQFLVHDITFDPTSLHEQQTDASAVRNYRTPALDLDALYGGGPRSMPHLYDAREEEYGKFLLGPYSGDLPRRADETALIGDPRNDENVITSQLHVAFLRFHNAVVNLLRATGEVADAEERFRRALDLTRWHYQWIIVSEYLPAVCHPEVLKRICEPLPDGKPDLLFYAPHPEPFLPVELSGAALRFGHSQLKSRYVINDRIDWPLFSANGSGVPDLRGHRRVPLELRVDWNRFFETGFPAQSALAIDTKISPALSALPTDALPPSDRHMSGSEDEARSLAWRNLARGIAWKLPSGTAVAEHMKGKLPENEREALLPERRIWPERFRTDDPPPLWFYVLREAEVQAGGQHLGVVGSRIVAEVVLGLLERDETSYLHADGGRWRPRLPSQTQDGFRMTDLLRFAGVLRDGWRDRSGRCVKTPVSTREYPHAET